MQTENSISLDRGTNLPLTTCPTCRMTWLTPGLSAGDKYECRNCGFAFIVPGLPQNAFPIMTPSQADGS